jgi:hypothetical protein
MSERVEERFRDLYLTESEAAALNLGPGAP